ncbi:hypothetical protein ACSBR1_024073 [Camellia fascicularis]
MMAGLQRSSTSFRRQGSSGLVWDDRFLSGELNKLNHKEDDRDTIKSSQEQSRELKKKSWRAVGSIERSISNSGGRGYRTGKVTPAIEPPSPRLSACGFCSAFSNNHKTRRRPNSGRRPS